MTTDLKKAIKLVEAANDIVVVQPENPDGDSLGSAIALEEIIGGLGKKVSLFCSVDMPRHLRYIKGWDRVLNELPGKYDLLIIVDTSSASLLEKLLKGANSRKVDQTQVLVLDHHDIETDLTLKNLELVNIDAVAVGEIIYDIVKLTGWKLNPNAVKAIAASIMSDSLGLTSVRTSAKTVYTIAELVDKHGLNLSELNNARRELSKKSVRIALYKADLIKRIEFFHDDRLAVVVIPHQEIKSYSDEYNPGALITEELAMIDSVDLSVVLKQYPDHITGRLRSGKTMISGQLAEHFGGGGHPYAAGFKTKDWSMDDLKKELVKRAGELLK